MPAPPPPPATLPPVPPLSAAPPPVSASPWRSLLWGMLGALILLVLASGVVGAVVAYRAYTAPDRLRATILRQIDEYEGWSREGAREIGQRACFTGSAPLSCAGYTAERDRFMAQHPELAAYEAWFLDARKAEFCPPGACGFRGQHMAQTYTIDDWRDHKYLVPYIRSRR